jgi:tetratricopeptide (TPR) repeat protein
MLQADPTLVVRMLSRVVADAPGFRPAWAKLLIAETETVGLLLNEGEQDAEALTAFRKHIEEAERRAPGLPEVTIARASLLPLRDFTGRVKLVEQAVAAASDDADVQSFYAGVLASVGRSNDGINAARAVELDPLSPALVNAYISTLAYGGATDAARRELDRAERLWPGAASVHDAQLRFHLRYGDPRIAKALFLRNRDTGAQAWRMFLDARVDRSAARVEQLMAYVGERLKRMANASAAIGFATLAYAQFGRSEQALQTLLGWPKPDDLAAMAEVLFRPELGEVRRDRRFMQIAHRAGLTRYWQSSGNWPDFCFENDMP